MLRRLAFNTIIYVDDIVELPPQYDDCVAVKRLHIVALSTGTSGHLSNQQNGILATESRREVDGWVSLTGRTLEDNKPIIELQ